MTGTSGSSSVFDSVMMRGFHNVSQNIYLDGLKVQGICMRKAGCCRNLCSGLCAERPASVLYGQSNPGSVVTMTIQTAAGWTPLQEIRLQGESPPMADGFDLSDALNDEETQAYRPDRHTA